MFTFASRLYALQITEILGLNRLGKNVVDLRLGSMAVGSVPVLPRAAVPVGVDEVLIDLFGMSRPGCRGCGYVA